MNKIFKRIFLGLVFILASYLAYFIYGAVVLSHSTDWTIWKEYMWIFRDSVKNNIDTNFAGSSVKKRDIYNHFLTKDTLGITVWEFKDLKNADLKTIAIKENENFDKVKFRAGEILNPNGDLPITVKWGFAFDNNTINVGLDKYSKIEKYINGTHYKGFYGKVSRLLLSNEKGEPEIGFESTKGTTQTVFLLYKGHQSFYIIMFDYSVKPFDESVINMLNLN